MILYHASTVYHSLCSIVHKLAYHPNEDAELLLVEYMFQPAAMKDFIKRLEACHWFSSIRVVPEAQLGDDCRANLKFTSSPDELETAAAKITEKVEKWLGKDLNSYDEVYLMAEQWAVGTAILYKKVPNYFFEDGSGLLGDENRYFQIVRTINVRNYALLTYFGGGGNNNFTKAKYCDMANQPEGFQDELAVDFNIYNILHEQIPDKVDAILNIYYGSRFHEEHSQETVLFMTQFIRTLAIQDFEVQKKITLLLWDYFIPANHRIVVKPHPKDCYLDYESMEPSCVVIDRRLPSELLPFVFEEPVSWALTASSTSLGGLKKFVHETMQFTTDIEVHFSRLHEYYIVSRILERVYDGQEICMSKQDQVYIENFLRIRKQAGILQEYWQPGRIWLNRIPKGKPDKDSVYIFTEWDMTFLFSKKFDPSKWLICEVEIEEQGKITTHNIFLYLKNKNRKKLIEMKETKVLGHTETTLTSVIHEADMLKMERAKRKALLHALQEKESEANDKVLVEMNTIIDHYYKKESSLETMMAEDGWKGEIL